MPLVQFNKLESGGDTPAQNAVAAGCAVVAGENAGGGGGHGRPRVSLDFRRLPPLPHMHAAGSGHSMFQHAHLATGRTSTRPSALAVTESSAQPTSGFSSRCMIQRRQSKHSSGHHRPAHADHGPTNSPPWSGSASCNSRVDGPRRIQPKSPTLTRFPTQSTHPAATAS